MWWGGGLCSVLSSKGLSFPPSFFLAVKGSASSRVGNPFCDCISRSKSCIVYSVTQMWNKSQPLQKILKKKKFFSWQKHLLKWQFYSNLVQQKQTCEFAQVHPIDVLGMTMNYESFSCPISLIPVPGCCVLGCAVSRPCGQNVLISCAWPEAMRLTLNPETGPLTLICCLCEPVTSLSQIPSPLLSSSLPWVGVITLKSQSVLNLALPISSSHCISQH